MAYITIMIKYVKADFEIYYKKLRYIEKARVIKTYKGITFKLDIV